MSVTIKRTLIRPKGREEYESRASASQLVTIATQEIVQQEESTTPSTNRAPARETETALPYYAGENITVVGRQISSPNSVQSLDVKQIVAIKKDDYDSLAAVSPSTLYLVYIPEFSALTASVKQNINIPASGLTLTSANLGDYFTCTATEVFNDGSTTDVTAEATFTMTAMTIGANSSGERSLDIPGGITAEWGGHSVNFAANVIQESLFIPRNIITYVSTDSQIINPYVSNFGAQIVSNTYYPDEGYGEIVCNGDVTKIGEQSFKNRSKLSNIAIPVSVTRIEDDAFSGCTALSSISISDNVTVVGNSAFVACTKLSSVTIGDGVTTIGNSAFRDCTKLSALTMGDNVAVIGDYSFSKCGITSITIPGVTTIGYGAFYNCGSLSSVTIESGSDIARIGTSAFTYCAALSSITIPDNVVSIGEKAFLGTAWYSNQPDGVVYAGKVLYEWKGDRTAMTALTITEGTKGIGDGALSSCTQFSSLTIPDSVVNIGHNAFYLCTKLSSVTIGDGVTTIGDSAFRGCTKLSALTMGDSVTVISSHAFYNCKVLLSITIPYTVTDIGSYAFYDCLQLSDINYTGTMVQWINITKGSRWNDGVPATVVHCTDGDVSI